MPDAGSGDLGTIQRSFERFARFFPHLRLYRRLAEGCAADDEVAGLLLRARPGQGRPILLFAAVHEWVLRRPTSELARWYATVTSADELAEDDPWPTFRRTVLDHRDELEAVIATRATQTNEVNRSVLVAVLLAAACADVPGVPVRLVELGSSAGLLLTPDLHRITIGDAVVGDPDSPVRVAGDVRGGSGPDLSGFPPVFADRVGIDRDPVPVTDPDGVRWLEACLWPDEPWRVERFRAAVTLARTDPPRLVAADMLDGLAAVVAEPADGWADGSDSDAGDEHLVVMNLWSLTYVARERRDAVLAILTDAARDRPAVTWVHAEPPDGVPGVEPPHWDDDEPWERVASPRPDTVLALHRWRDGRTLGATTLGWAHPHGNWVHYTGSHSDPTIRDSPTGPPPTD